MKEQKPSPSHPWRKAAIGWRKTSGDTAVEKRQEEEIDMENRYDRELDNIINEEGLHTW